MDTYIFLSHESLADYIYSEAAKGKSVVAVLFYEDAKRLLKELARYKETSFDDIELHDCLYDGYDDEYYIIVDEDLCIWSERAYNEVEETGFKGYFRFGDEDVIALIDGDANSQVIKAAEGCDYIAEIEIVDDTCCDDECEFCEFHDECAAEENDESALNFLEFMLDRL
jgi:hypothetical protein